MREPTEPGTIVLLSNGEALLLVNPKAVVVNRWWSMTHKVWQDWAEVSDLVPSIVRYGYTPPPPPTPEPTLPYAVVRDAEGDVAFKAAAGEYYVRNIDVLPWSGLVQPVEILFPGVPDA
jgi:hypothetical protein